MVCLQVLTGCRKEALLIGTCPLGQLFVTGRRTEISSRSAYIMNVSLEVLVLCELLRLCYQRVMTCLLYTSDAADE